MTREVNIKALVSHVVKGDGIDKCRICMGDTSEGQVFLSDTVMMEGDKPITLSELLEAITGVEVLPEEEMPGGLCSACSASALNAAHFRTFCRQSWEQWETSLELLSNLHCLNVKDINKPILVILSPNNMTVINRYSDVDSDTSGSESTASESPQNENYNWEKNTLRGIQCTDCGKKFKYAQQLHQHLKEATDFKRACHLCARIMTRDELVTHMYDFHGRKPYDCKKCPALLHTYSQYKRHIIKAHSKGSCCCGDCGRSFQSSQAYHAHLSIHKVKTCPGCDKLFRNQTCYFHHVVKCCNLNHNRKDTYRTKHKVFVQVKNRRSKKKIRVGMRGSTDKECICDYCGKTFAGKRIVRTHIQIVHTKDTHRPCEYCGKLLATAHIAEHLKTHDAEPSFTCEQCGVVLRTKLGFNQHLRLHTGEKPYKCQYCGKSFSASSRRSEHIRNIHRSSEIELKCVCDFCPAKYRLPYQLKKHIISVHEADFPQFECKECHEKFTSYRGLLHHGLKHQDCFKINRRMRGHSKVKMNIGKMGYQA